MKYKMAMPFFLYNIYMENKIKVKPAEYKWWKDNKMIGTILLIVSICLLIFTFVKVPVISSITGYTIGMLLGFYAPLFYLFIIYKSLIMIFGNYVKLPHWIKLTDLTYLIVVTSILFISSSTGFYQAKSGFTSFGGKPWGSFNNWYDTFTDSNSAWTPKNTNGGLIGVFMYSFTAMIFSGIGALILSIALLVISASIMISGTTIGLYRDLIKRKKLDLKAKEIKDDKETDIAQFETKEDIEPPEEPKKTEILPFDDPF